MEGREEKTTLFVANLVTERTSEDEVRHIFEKYGTVTDVKLKTSYGFVSFASSAAAREAKEGEKGRLIGGKPIDIEYSKSSKPPAPKRDYRDRGDRDYRSDRDRTPYARPRQGRDDGHRDRDRDRERDVRDRERGPRSYGSDTKRTNDRVLCNVYYYGMFTSLSSQHFGTMHRS
jgi:RNA recognition motif-containing protein